MVGSPPAFHTFEEFYFDTLTVVMLEVVERYQQG